MGIEQAFGDGIITTQLDKVLNWSRRWSFFCYPFITACCGMEYMSVASSHYDLARFGAEFPRFSPRQADLMLIVGTICHKVAPVVKLVYEQMCEPKWVIAVGACASSGGFYRNYSVVQGVDRIIPVDVYVPGCPPRPEAFLDAIIKMQEKVDRDSVLNYKN